MKNIVKYFIFKNTMRVYDPKIVLFGLVVRVECPLGECGKGLERSAGGLPFLSFDGDAG